MSAVPAAPGGDTDIVFTAARELVRRLVEREIGAEELMRGFLARIDAVNPQVNAIVTLLPEAALQGARAADAALARGAPLGPLHGLPIAVKDVTLTRGIRTTFGSPLYRDFVPAADALYVERLRAAGATSSSARPTPRSSRPARRPSTRVFGATRNPYATDRTCGGSSGGAAVAVACGMLPFADGTDVGGSLRTPASWCNVVGFRTSPGRVPLWPRAVLFDPLDVAGPIARHAADAALLLSVMAGPDRRVPHASETPGARFRAPLERDFRGTRVAWSPTLGGCPMEPVVGDVCGQAVARLAELGCVVEEAEPDLRDADEIFRTLRAIAFARTHERHLRQHREALKDTVVWNTEQGLALSAMDVARAEMRQAALFDRVVDFFGRFDYLVCPTDAGRAVPGGRRLGARDRRGPAGDLHRLDGGLLPDYGDRLPGPSRSRPASPPTASPWASRSSPRRGATSRRCSSPTPARA